MNPDVSFGHGAPERPEEPPLRKRALAYAEHGWLVLPLWWPTRTGDCACGLPDCDRIGKHPIRRLVPHGLYDATTQGELVNDWWRSFPDANVAIRTGAESGVVVLDVDGEAGRLALRGLVACHALFQARWVRTGSGGWHAYFAHPGTTVPNSAGRLGEGLDVRGDGGYAVAPPSRHTTYRRYRWIVVDGVVGEERSLPSMPGWLVDLVTIREEADTEPQPVCLRTEDVSAYGLAALQQEAGAVAQAPVGQRNHQLNRAAFKIGQLVGAGVVQEPIAVEALVAAGLAAGPGERKIRSTVRRAIRAGMSQPRRLVIRARAGEGDGAC